MLLKPCFSRTYNFSPRPVVRFHRSLTQSSSHIRTYIHVYTRVRDAYDKNENSFHRRLLDVFFAHAHIYMLHHTNVILFTIRVGRLDVRRLTNIHTCVSHIFSMCPATTASATVQNAPDERCDRRRYDTSKCRSRGV